MLDGARHASPEQAQAASGDPGMDELMRQFETALQEMQNDPSLDRDTREFLRQQFAQTLSDVGSGENEPAGIPDRAVWMDAVQALQASGAVKESEVNDLIRQINQALQPLQRRESQLAIEFSRRLQTDGQDEALAWFRKESQQSDNAADAEPSSSFVSPESRPLRAEVVNSRSRRLRGPP
jgi:hypothetical protein